MDKFIIQGEIIGTKNGIPIVDDSNITKASKSDSKFIKYHLIKSFKKPSDSKKNSIIYSRKSQSKIKSKNSSNNSTSYTKFNEVIKKFKTKNDKFNLTREERSELWQLIKQNIEDGSMKATKKEIIEFIKQ